LARPVNGDIPLFFEINKRGMSPFTGWKAY